MRTVTAAVFMVFMISAAKADTLEVKIEADGALTDKEKAAIENQKKILDEIMKLYAERALERPKDFTACAREMFALRRNNKCRDKFTHYYTLEEVKRFQEDMSGKFGGVGVEITQEEGGVVVVAPIGGTPAERAGLRPRDIILKIDGKEVEDINGATSLIRGKAGTEVTITIFRKETKKELVFTLIREIISVRTVKWRLHPADKKIGIINIRRFDNTVSEKFAEAVVGIVKKGAKGAIIDLRNNPGGLVRSVTALLALFAESQDTIMTFRHRQSKETIAFDSMPRWAQMDYREASGIIQKVLKLKSLKNFPVVILINGGSASASEIFSGTMKDWGYPVVGEKSFGKGVAQEIIGLSDGSRLALTTFEFLVGNSLAAIRDKGVMPTIEIKPDWPKDGKTKKYDKKDDKNDIQLKKALEVLQFCGKNDPKRAYNCVRQ